MPIIVRKRNCKFWFCQALLKRIGVYRQFLKLTNRTSPVDAARACAPGSGIVFATDANVASLSVPTLHHHFPFQATRGANGLYAASAITLAMRLCRAFSPSPLARPVIILVMIGRDNHATGKDKSRQTAADQLVFHGDLHQLGWFFKRRRNVRQSRGLNPHFALVASLTESAAFSIDCPMSLTALSISFPVFSAGPSFWQAERVNPKSITATNPFSFGMATSS